MPTRWDPGATAWTSHVLRVGVTEGGLGEGEGTSCLASPGAPGLLTPPEKLEI